MTTGFAGGQHIGRGLGALGQAFMGGDQTRQQGMRAGLENTMLLQKMQEMTGNAALEQAKYDDTQAAAGQTRDDIFAAGAARGGTDVPTLRSQEAILKQGDRGPFTDAFKAGRNERLNPIMADILAAVSGKAGDIKTSAEVPGVEASSRAQAQNIAEAMQAGSLDERMLGTNRAQGRGLEGLTPPSDIRSVQHILALPQDQQQSYLDILKTLKPNPNEFSSFPGGLYNRATGAPVPGTAPALTVQQWVAQQVAAGAGAQPPAAAPAGGVPPGMKQVGTANGKPVYEDAQGRRFQ